MTDARMEPVDPVGPVEPIEPQLPRRNGATDMAADLETPVEVRRIRSIESGCDPFSVLFDGWCAWAVLRPHVISRLARLPLAASARVTPRARLRAAAGDVARLALPARRRYLLKTYASGLAEVAGDRFRDVWFDDVADGLEGVFKVEQVNNPLFLERSSRALRRRDATNELLDGFLPGALARAAGAPGAAAAAAALRARLAAEPELSSLDERFIVRVLAAFYWGTRLWERLLRRVGPEAVLTADPYEAPLIAAARRTGIPVVELQHGLNDPAHHAAYAWAPEARARKRQLPLPDRLFVYGDHWRDRLAAGGFWDRELVPVGSARMDRYRSAAAPRRSDRGLIVVTTQGLDVPDVLAFLGEWLALLGEREDVELVLKLHPAYETDRTPYLERFGDDARVRVLLGSEEPSTLALVGAAHLHLSISSTCHYEALALGTPTVVLPFTTHEIMLPLCRSGHATLVRSAAELAALTGRWREIRLPREVGDHYFSPGAATNVRREIARLTHGDRVPSLATDA